MINLALANFLVPGSENAPRKTYWIRLLLPLAASLLLALAGCRSSSPGEKAGGGDGGKLKVAATIGMISDVAGRVGGDRVRVDGLMGPGVDPHLYKASEGDVRRLGEADVVFYNGLHLEARMGDVLEKMGKSRRVVAVTDGIDRSRLFKPPQFEGNYDPHVWFDVTMWMKAVEKIRDTLIEADAAGAESYRTNAEQYLKELAELHEYVKARAEAVPAAQRVLITAHDAFNYFGRAYGFEVRGLQGISTASEAGAADVNSLAGFIAERRIPAIFIESSVPHRNVEAVQEAVRARKFEVKIGGELFSDAMGNEGTTEGTYIGMVRHNIDTITSALGAR